MPNFANLLGEATRLQLKYNSTSSIVSLILTYSPIKGKDFSQKQKRTKKPGRTGIKLLYDNVVGQPEKKRIYKGIRKPFESNKEMGKT